MSSVKSRKSFFRSHSRELASPSTTVLFNEIPTEDAKSEKKRSLKFKRNLRHGYRKQVWRLVGILGIVIAVGTFCCFNSSRGWNRKFLHFNDLLTALTFDYNPTTNQPSNEYRWDGSNENETDVPPGARLWPSPPKTILTTLSEQDKGKLKKMKIDFEKYRSSEMLLPCRLDDSSSCFRDIASSVTEADASDRRILLHNPLQEDRFWCGKRIWGGGGTLEVTDSPDQCKEGGNEGLLPYLYSKRPPRIPNKSVSTDDSVVTVELFWNIDDEDGDYYNNVPTKLFPCSIPCTLNDNYNIINTITVRNTKWQITHTMEGEKIYPEARVRPSSYRESQFYATTSFKSEIPVPYFSWNEYKIQHAAVDFSKAIKGASFIANNCESMNKREKVVKALIDTSLRVDSLSECLNSANPLPGVDMENKTAVMERYLFHLAFENQRSDDYITEKLWGALGSGTLPVYLGASNVKEHVPRNSIIVAEDFKSPQDLADYLIRMTEDKDLYESYHKWRYQTIDGAFASKYEFTNTHSNCRMCKWVFAKRHGFGWNHSKQTILKPYIDHKTCRNQMGLIGYPFKEYWLSSMSSSEGGGATEESMNHVFSTDTTKTCLLNEKNRFIEVDHGAIRRKVYDRDGVTDLIIDVTTGGNRSSSNFDHYILRLVTPIKAGGANQRPRVLNDSAWWLQDDQSRFYIMARGDGDVNLSVQRPGIIEVSIPSPRSSSSDSSTTIITTRVRIVTENMDHFHQKTKKTPSYFGDLMMRDFFEPVASYRILD